jgi:hypothetical protein
MGKKLDGPQSQSGHTSDAKNTVPAPVANRTSGFWLVTSCYTDHVGKNKHCLSSWTEFVSFYVVARFASHEQEKQYQPVRRS